MGFRKRKEQEEELEILCNRLFTSTYDEDKLEALENINEIAYQMPVTVGTICLKYIYQSLKEMSNISLQIAILEQIINTQFRNEFTEIIFDDPENISILLNRTTNEILKIFNIFASEIFFKKILGNSRCTELLRVLIESDAFSKILPILGQNIQLKERLVFDGTLEIVLEKLFKNAHNQNSKLFFELKSMLLTLIEDSIVSQNYFMESKLYNHKLFSLRFEDPFDIQIYFLLLNPTNQNNFEKYQNVFFTPKILHRSVEFKKYNFIYRICLQNAKNLSVVFKKYINSDILVEDAEKSKDAFALLYLLRNHLDLNNVHSSDYKINILLGYLGYKTSLEYKVLSDLSQNNISIDLLMYILLTFDSITHISNLLSYKNLDSISESICFLIFFSHNVEVEFNVHQMLNKMKNFRKIAIETVFVNDEINEMVVGIACEYIKFLLEKINNIDQINSPEQESTPVLFNTQHEQTVTPTLGKISSIKNNSFQRISEAFDLFRKDDKKHDTYDL